jgi:hypothetical protein
MAETKKTSFSPPRRSLDFVLSFLLLFRQIGQLLQQLFHLDPGRIRIGLAPQKFLATPGAVADVGEAITPRGSLDLVDLSPKGLLVPRGARVLDCADLLRDSGKKSFDQFAKSLFATRP